MIELKNDKLVFTFPEIHPEAKLSVSFQRTLRIPDDDQTYPLPPGLGSFPLKHIDDFEKNVPSKWIDHGGVMMPMYQSEAMWLNFESDFIDEHDTSYPFAIRIATGKINAITGEQWVNTLSAKPQDYLVVPEQPWLDGYCVEKDMIRQFVATPLGSGFTAEEQITGKSAIGGMQIMVFPMKKTSFEKHFPKIDKRDIEELLCCLSAPASVYEDSCEMGFSPGGRMHQEIYDDPYEFEDWHQSLGSRCFLHITNSLVWRAITDELPPTPPFTSKEYTKHGMPWFDYYDDNLNSINGAENLKKLKSVVQMEKEKGFNVLPENKSVKIEQIVSLKDKANPERVREGSF